jgi:hypothetical protein
MNKRVNKTFTSSNQNLKENTNPGHNNNMLAESANLARKDSTKMGMSSAGGIEESH